MVVGRAERTGGNPLIEGGTKGTQVTSQAGNETRGFGRDARRGRQTLFFMAAWVKMSSLSSLGMFSRNCRTCFFLLSVPTRADITT